MAPSVTSAWVIVASAGYRFVFGWADTTAIVAAVVGFLVACRVGDPSRSPTRLVVASLAFALGVSTGVALAFFVPGLPDMVAGVYDLLGWLLFVLAMIAFTFLPALLLGACWAALLALFGSALSRSALTR